MTTHAPLDPAAALQANAATPFERARAMPKSVYTSEAFLAREIEDIFKTEWFCAGRADALANPGDYTTLDLAGQPVLVIRGKDGVLRAMSNVCRHRMSTLLEGSGNAGSIVCPYHAWTYGLDGHLRAAPAMTRNEGFCREDIALPPIRCTEWLGWVMVTLNPDAPPVEEALAEVEALIGDYDMGAYRQAFFETFTWDTNWKVLAENFMESYHLPVCHAVTIGGLSRLDEMVCPPGREAFNYHWILKPADFKLGCAHPNNTRIEGEERRRTTYLLAIYPSLLITITPGYFWYLSLHPKGPGQVAVRFGGGLAREFAEDPEAQAMFDELKTLLDKVNVEDKGCTERVYRGLLSDAGEPGFLSHLERPNYEFAGYLARKIPA